MSELWLVVPVYNEEQSLPLVIEEWMPVLRDVAPGFVFCALNDGSKDSSLKILHELRKRHPELRVVDKPNTGHGQTCVHGYRLAAAEGAEWIFQIDSDGQCDPRFFSRFWEARKRHHVIYGFRSKRDDGFKRYLISRFVSIATYIGTGIWVRDANVPYRLMHVDAVTPLIPKIPRDFHLSNILLAALHKRHFGIHWIDIHFRNRVGGVPSVKAYSFLKNGLKLLKQLRRKPQTTDGLTRKIASLD